MDFAFRGYDSRIGRFISTDPIGKDYPWNSPYAFAENDPINFVDLEGLEKPLVRAAIAIPIPRGRIPVINAEQLLKGVKGIDIHANGGAMITSVGALEQRRNQIIAEERATTNAISYIVNTIVDLFESKAVGRFISRTQNLSVKELDIARRRGVERAWKEERKLVERTGAGTRDWSEDEIEELLTKGKVGGYAGHHRNDVKNHPELADNPDNVEFLRTGSKRGGAKKGSEHYDKHNKDGKKVEKTEGELLQRNAKSPKG